MVTLRQLGSSFLPAVLVALAAPSIARAQNPAPVSIGVGYQFLRFSDLDLTYPIGVIADASVPIGQSLSLVGEGGWARHSEEAFGLTFTSRLLHVGGGLRYSVRRRVTPYGQVLVSVERSTDSLAIVSESTTDLAVGADGGVEVHAAGPLRAFVQAGIRRVFYEGQAENGVRIVAGVRVPIGR